MQLAAMTLPTHLQDVVFGKMIYHDGSKNSAGSSRLNPQSCSHPIIVSHPETGLDTLYLGRKFGCFVEGESAENSAALLDELWQHVEAQPSWFHQWDVGDTLVWDNRSTLHCRTSFNEDCGRLLYRVQTAGSKPQPSALFY
jgi:taurine dioxygenase